MYKKISGFIVATALVGCLSILTPACATRQVVTNGVTNTVTQLDPQKTANAVAAILPAGVSFAVSQDTNSAPYFRAAIIVINAALDKGQYDPADLEVTLKAISIKEMRTPEAKVAVEAGLAIYRAYFGDALSQKLDQTVWVKPVLQALSDGITAGLN